MTRLQRLALEALAWVCVAAFAAVLVGGQFGLAELIHHSGRNPFTPAAVAEPATLAPATDGAGRGGR